LADYAALSADLLATELRVTVWSAEDIRGVSAEAARILADDTDQSWSALTMRMGPDHLIVYKPVASAGRRNSVIMHELAHIILGHQLASACILDDGSLVPGNFDQAQEDEADWLAGTLLLPRPALMSIRYRRLNDASACREYLVSGDMLAWRFRMTGVDYQLASRRA
jgi:Zn-dependent peptidase ImmA (M78 family)